MLPAAALPFAPSPPLPVTLPTKSRYRKTSPLPFAGPASPFPPPAEPGEHRLNLVNAQRGTMVSAAAPASKIHLAGVQQGLTQLKHVDLAAVVVVESGKGREKFRRRG